MQDHRGTTNSPQTPSKARPLLQRFLTSPLLSDSPPPSPTYKATTTARASSTQRMSYQKQLSYQSISSSSSTSSLSSTYSYPRLQYSPVQMASQQKDATSRSEALLRSTLLRDDRSSSPQPQASSSRIPVLATSSTSSSTNSRPGHRRRHSYAVAPQSTRFGFGVSRQGSVSGAGVDADGDEGTESGEASLYMRANLMRRRSTNTGAPSGYMSDRSTTPRPPTLNANATPHGPSSLSSAAATQNVYGGDAEVDPRADSPQTAPFTNAARRQSSHITTTSIIPTSSSKRNSPTSSSPSPTKTTHSPPVTSKTGSIISSPRIQPSPFPQTPAQKKRQSFPASYTSSPAPHTATLPSMQQLALPVPPATIPESQLTTQEKELRARLERVLKADKKAAKKAAQEAARRARSHSRSPMKGQRNVMSEEAGNSLRFVNGDVYLTDDDSDEEGEEESGSNGKVSSEESLENSQAFGVARERKISMNEVRDEEGSCPWRNDPSTSTSSSSSSLPAMATTASPTYSPKIDYTAHMRSRTEASAYTPRHQAQPLPSSPAPYAADGFNTNKRPPSSPLVNPRTPRTQPPHLPASPHMLPSGHEMGRTTSTRRRHAATFNLPAPPSAGVSPRARSASLAPSPRHQTIPLAQAQRNPDSLLSMPPPEEESRRMMITPPPTPPSGRSASRPARGAEGAARNSPFVYATTRSPRVHSSRRHANPRSGSSSTSSSSEYDEGCLDEGHIPPLSLHENNEVDIASSPDASPDPSRPSYFNDQGISHPRRPLPLMTSALFPASEDDANMPYSAPSYRPTFNARKASERLRSAEGYISFSSVEGLGCPPEYLGDDDGKKDDERGRKGWKGLVGLSWVFGGGASAAEV